jgi:hypothetical protein
MTQDKETIGTILVPHDGTEMSDKAPKKAELLQGLQVLRLFLYMLLMTDL